MPSSSSSSDSGSERSRDHKKHKSKKHSKHSKHSKDHKKHKSKHKSSSSSKEKAERKMLKQAAEYVKAHESAAADSKKPSFSGGGGGGGGGGDGGGGGSGGPLPFGASPITPDDYFSRSVEFRLWLKQSKGSYLDELETSVSRAYFVKFVSKWNAGSLPGTMYNSSTMENQKMDASLRTRHKWNIKVDSFELGVARDSVDTATNVLSKAAVLEAAAAAAAVGQKRSIGGVSGPGGGSSQGVVKGPMKGPSMPPPGHGGGGGGGAFNEDGDPYESRKQARLAEKSQDRAYQRQHKDTLEELAPRPDPGSHAAKMEKRSAKAPMGKNEERDVEADLGGGDSFRARLEAQKRGQAERAARRMPDPHAARAKVSEIQDKEKERMAAFRVSMGLPAEGDVGGARPMIRPRE